MPASLFSNPGQQVERDNRVRIPPDAHQFIIYNDDGEDKNEQNEGKTSEPEVKLHRSAAISEYTASIMQEVGNLNKLTGSEVLLLVAEGDGILHTYASARLKPLVMQSEGRALIQSCMGATKTFPSHPDPAPTSRMPQQFQNTPQASGVTDRVDSDLSASGKSSQTTRNRQARKRPRSSSASRAERMISMPPLQQPMHSSDQLPISSTQSLSNTHTLRLRGGRSLPTHSMTDAMARNEPVGGEMLMCTADTDTGLRLKVAISYAQQQHKEAPWYFPWMHILQRQLSFELSTGTSTSVIALPFPQLPVDAEVDTYENPWDWTVDQAAGNQLGATVAVYESGGSDKDSEEDLAGNLEEYLAATVDDLNGAMRQSLSPDPLALDCLPDDLRESIGRCIHNRQTSSLSPGILHSNKRQSLSPDPLLLGCRPDSIQQLSNLGVSSFRGGTPVPSNVGAIAPLQNGLLAESCSVSISPPPALRLSRRIPDFTVKMFRTTCNSDGNIVIENEQTILIAEIKPAIKDSKNLSEIRRHVRSLLSTQMMVQAQHVLAAPFIRKVGCIAAFGDFWHYREFPKGDVPPLTGNHSDDGYTPSTQSDNERDLPALVVNKIKDGLYRELSSVFEGDGVLQIGDAESTRAFDLVVRRMKELCDEV